VRPQSEKMLVAAHEKFGFTGNSTLEHSIIVRIVSDSRKNDARSNNLRMFLQDHPDEISPLVRQPKLEAQLVIQFVKKNGRCNQLK
jgi:hypothetical protein